MIWEFNGYGGTVAILDEKWKGQACLANPLFGTTSMHAAALFGVWGDEQAKNFFEGLTANQYFKVWIAVPAGTQQHPPACRSGLHD